MNRVLVVIDMQNDFIDGSLGTEMARSIYKRASYLLAKYDTVIFTQDTHPVDYEKTDEFKIVPIRHCIKNTFGWKIHSSFKTEGCKVIEKDSFASKQLVEHLKTLKDITSITIIGLVTDICVIENAKLIKQAFKDIPIIILKDYCAGTSVQKHYEAIEEMKKIGIEIKDK